MGRCTNVIATSPPQRGSGLGPGLTLAPHPPRTADTPSDSNRVELKLGAECSPVGEVDP